MSKASRGRGRGRGSVSINIETIGFGRGEQLPAPALQPPPKYPPLRKQPIPLLTGDEVNYLLALKKEFVQTMQSSPYYIRTEVEKNDVERYSDKYRTASNPSNTIEWEPDWRRLPKELKLTVRKRKRASKLSAPNLTKSRTKKKGDSREITGVLAQPYVEDDSDIKKKLDDLEKKDVESENKLSEKEEEESETEEVEGIVEQDEDEEEENDYLTSYFDNGESYLDEEDDNLDDKEGGIY